MRKIGFASVAFVLPVLVFSVAATTASEPWVIQTVDSDGNVGEFNSIAVDSSGYAHISYHDYTNGDLKYATNDPGD